MRLDRYAPVLAMLLVSALVLGCQTDAPELDDESDTTQTGPMELKIVKAESGPDYPDAKLTVMRPAKDEVVTGDSVMVQVNLTGVDLSAPTAGEQSKGIAYSKDGQHIHVIIDDQPYMAMYMPEGFSVGKLTDGVHTLRVFPSRSWHESIKTPGAFVAHSFYVKKKTGTPVLVEGGPLLTYSRPKGEYRGRDAKRVLLDFYVSNAQLGANAYKVVASVDGKLADTLTEWVPYYIEGLTDGEHTVRLQLIGPDGKPVPGPFNTAEGKITVAREATPPPTTEGHDSGALHGNSPDTSKAIH